MNKLDKKITCPKCGFIPTYNKDWKLEFKDDCTSFGYNKCEWDSDKNGTKEHLHQECPECGYTITAPCMDSEAVKANTWNTTTPVAGATTTPGGMGQLNQQTQALVAQNRGNVTPIAGTRYVNGKPVTTPVTPVRCQTCPVESAEAK